ncbi:MAG: flagellar assembly protein FlgT [Gammaproteobacteria bacterium]|nr:flagellar assembly protein FlgT [Gammaproteobacteria bacterium]
MPTIVSQIIFCLIANLILAFSVSADTIVEAQGSAVIKDGAVGMAREQAIKNAMRQAATQFKSEIDSTTLTSSSVLLIESTRVNAASRVEDVKVLQEWAEKDVYHVHIRAKIPRDGSRPSSPAARYRKKVAILQFDIIKKQHVIDFPGIEQDWPRELLGRLESSGSFLGEDGTQYLISRDNPGYKFDDPETYAVLADKLDVQIIVSGVIHSMEKRDGLVFDQRDIDIELFIHDGVSGARIANHRFSKTVEGVSLLSDARAWITNKTFMHSAYGKAMSEIMNRHVEMIRNNLQMIPFTARIVQISGNEIIFNAGATSLVEVGDTLMTYRLSPDPIRFTQKEFFLGRRETPVATLAVEQVQPLFSVGRLEIDKAQLFPGDIIRFGR